MPELNLDGQKLCYSDWHFKPLAKTLLGSATPMAQAGWPTSPPENVNITKM